MAFGIGRPFNLQSKVSGAAKGPETGIARRPAGDRFMGRHCFLSGAIVLALATLATAEPPRKSTRWYSWLNPFKKTESPAKEQQRAKNEESAKPVESPAARSAREKADWLRRVAVCTQLEDIALETNDEELRRQAESLSSRAWEMYLKRSGTTLAGRSTPLNDSAAQRRPVDSSRAEQDRIPTGPRARGANQE